MCVISSFTRTLPNMENFAFGNLTHHKGLVPESAELQFIDRLLFPKADKNIFL